VSKKLVNEISQTGFDDSIFERPGRKKRKGHFLKMSQPPAAEEKEEKKVGGDGAPPAPPEEVKQVKEKKHSRGGGPRPHRKAPTRPRLEMLRSMRVMLDGATANDKVLFPVEARLESHGQKAIEFLGELNGNFEWSTLTEKERRKIIGVYWHQKRNKTSMTGLEKAKRKKEKAKEGKIVHELS
jgi:hypothetical protein